MLSRAMGPSKRFRIEHATERARVPRDPTQWSVAGQRSYSAIGGFYEDKAFPCPRCGNPVDFPASMQRTWFEELKRHPSARPAVCGKCHELGRSERNLEMALRSALRASRARPQDTELLLALARQRIRYFEGTELSRSDFPTVARWRHLSWRSGSKNLRAAIAECERARGNLSTSSEALYWMGRAHLWLNDRGAAHDCLSAFVLDRRAQDSLAELVADAHLRLNQR